jgi:putative FmdB family regulatory protein
MYQYACRECEQVFEKRLPMSQASETQECPGCGSNKTRKVIGAIAVNSGATTSTSRSGPPAASPFS